jgi:Family of unknown function (DUF6609)
MLAETASHALSRASAFPMAPAGGLFITIVGMGIVFGAVFPNKRDSSLVCAFIVATAALVIFGGHLMAPFGNPTRLQLWFLFGSIALEILLFRLAMPRWRKAGERSARLGSLFIVGLHFLPMAVAFGPMCLTLGIVLCLCSGAGIWLRPALPLNGLWAADGVLKIAFGSVMALAL